MFAGETGAVLAVSRTHAYCLYVSYDSERVPASVLPALVAFNRANKLVRELMDRAPPLVIAAELLIRDEKELRRDVLAANLGAEGLCIITVIIIIQYCFYYFSVVVIVVMY